MERSVCLLVNPSSGSGRALRALPAVREELRRLGVTVHAEQTSSLEHGAQLAVRAARRGEVVATLSGDGLLGAVAGALREVPGAVLGILPGGRGNDLARMLGIPTDPVAACAVLAGGRERAIDVGEVGGRAFVGIASCGYDSEVNRLAADAPVRLGRFVYIYAALRALLGWRTATFTVTADGDERCVTGWSVGAANSGMYGGGMRAAPDARLDDGMLDVVVLGDAGRLRVLTRILPRVFSGRYVGDRTVTVRRARELHVEADRPFAVWADGEPIADLPVTITVDPQAVRVLCPTPS